MKLSDNTSSSSVIPTSDSTLGAGLESMESMETSRTVRTREHKRAAERRNDRRIRSLSSSGRSPPLAPSRKEYIDDGYTGTLLDRPALEQLRQDVKTDQFDAIYFLCADRIAREVAHQTIIIDELRKRRKQIVINGKDYEQNPETKLEIMGLLSTRVRMREMMEIRTN